MKVRELIEQLEAMDPEMDVRVAQPTHDHWHSVAAAEIITVEEQHVKHSQYHSQDVLEDEEDVTYAEDDEEEGIKVGDLKPGVKVVAVIRG